MDAKASAKSKRTHSLHGNRKWSTHANPNAKNPSQSAATSDKNQSRERNRRSRAAPNLPSNWDRYHEDEVESDPENPSADVDGTGRASAEVAAPKSKGADFKELISQAQTDARAYSKSSSDVFASFDVLPDFYQGVSTMLSVRGKSLLSWCADDNFDVDENATSNYEAPFLSMDLHALAAQLEKIDVSKRLFIESDLLPADSNADLSEESSSQGGSLATVESNRERVINEKKLNSLNEVMPSIATSIDISQGVGLETREQSSESSSFSTISEQVVKSDPFDQGGSEESTMAINIDAATDLKEKDSRFEAAAAEAELDILLNSFCETKFFDSGSSVMEPQNGFPVAEGGFPVSSKESTSMVATQPTVQLPGTSRHTSTAFTLDDAIDDLLGEASISFNQKNEPLSESGMAVPVSLPSHSSYSGSQALDDFDSWMDSL